MGLFGELDANDVSDNPFYVAPDKYRCVLTEANVVEKKDGSGHGLSFKWVIEDEDSDYYQQNISDWKNIYPDFKVGDEQTQQMKRDFANLRKRLTEMGLSPDEQNVLLEDDNLENLIGMTAYVDVVESQGKGDNEGVVYTNVRSVTRLDAE